MAIFAKSFLMSSKNLAECKSQDHVPFIKEKLVPRSKRYKSEGVELRAYPDPAKNIDDADKNVKNFDDPKLIKKWISRAHGNNEMSARIYRSHTILNISDATQDSGILFMNFTGLQQRVMRATS